MNKLKVLIADDSPEWQETIRLILENSFDNIQIDQAYTAKKIEELIDVKQYDLIIFDIGLPIDETDLSKGKIKMCLDLLGKIRSSKYNNLSAIIVLTGNSEIAIAISAVKEYKAFQFFEKDNFPTDQFPKAFSSAIFQSRLWKLEERAHTRCQLTIHLSKDKILGCEVHGNKFSALHLDLSVNFDCEEFARRGDNLNLYFSSRDGIERWRPEAKFIGKEIYDKLFSERDILESLFKAQAKVKSTNDLWIQIKGSVNTIGVPFELMHSNHDYLSLQHIFTRSLNGYNIWNKGPFHLFIKDLVQSDQTLRILIVGSNSDGKIPEVEDEVKQINKEISSSLAHLGIKFKIDSLDTQEATFKRVSEALKTGEYHIFHFCGHGDFEKNLPENSGIWLIDEYKTPKKLNASQLNLLTENADLQFVFLSCCLSAATADRSGKGDFYSIFEALVRAGVPSVIGYRWEVSDNAASLMARKFYHKLWRLLSLEEAFHYAKQELKFEQNLNDETWASPVLLLQTS